MSCASDSSFQDIWLGTTDVKDHFKSAEMVPHAVESLWLYETGNWEFIKFSKPTAWLFFFLLYFCVSYIYVLYIAR